MKKRRIRATPKTTFASCGLDKENNILQAPICRCGCGHYANLVLKMKQDLYDFMGSMLKDHDCNHCAIFALHKDGSAAMAVKMEGKITIYGTNENAKQVITDLQKDIGFHCYGLMEQVDAELYRIVMD